MSPQRKTATRISGRRRRCGARASRWHRSSSEAATRAAPGPWVRVRSRTTSRRIAEAFLA